MLHLPFLSGYLAYQLAVPIHGKRELDTCPLQLFIGRKVEYEVIEKHVGSLGHRTLGNDIVHGVDRRSIGRYRVLHHGVLHRHLLIGTSHRRKTYSNDDYQPKYKYWKLS